MITIVQNKQGERGVITTFFGFNRAVKLGDVLAARFVDAEVVGRLPFHSSRGQGWFSAMLATIEATGAIYPNADWRHLLVVDPIGQVLARGTKGFLGGHFNCGMGDIATALFTFEKPGKIGGRVIHGPVTRRK